jgi:hypothetical protein
MPDETKSILHIRETKGKRKKNEKSEKLQYQNNNKKRLKIE